MQYPYSGEQNANKGPCTLDSKATVYFSATNYSSRPVSEINQKPESSNIDIEEAEPSTIEEAESSIRGSDSLNNEEARAVLGKYEYQKGNIESALHVFEVIDMAAISPKIKFSLDEFKKPQRHSHNYAAPPYSVKTAGLLLEAAYFKSKSLQHFGRYKEAAESCKTILEIIESIFPEGVPENLGADNKLQETLSDAIELLPHLWQLSNMHKEAILSFRRALLNNYNLKKEIVTKIQKEFAIYLLYNGGGEEANTYSMEFQTDDSYTPKNNVEEAILLLMLLLRNVSLKINEGDPSILDHLCYALSIYGGLGCLGKQLEELLPGIIDDNERHLLLALCYYGQGDNITAMSLLKIIYENDNPNCGLALLIASKICGETENFNSVGLSIAKKAIQVCKDKCCDEVVGVAYSLLGVALSAHSRTLVSDGERVKSQCEALECLETAGRLTKLADSRILYDLSLENAEQRKLDAALGCVNRLIDLEGGSHLKGWMLLARILSAQKRFEDSEAIVNAALEQTVKWDQGEPLRTKARLQLAQGQVKRAIQTYTQLLANLQVQYRSFGLLKKHQEVGENRYLRLELETWNDLAKVYISLSQFDDAEACLSKSKAITNYSASTRHTFGLLYEAKGDHKQALKAYKHALDADPVHVESLISIAVVFRKLGAQSAAVARSFLNEALRVDRMNSSAWYNLGLIYKDEGPMYLSDAVDCFQAAGVLKETEPIEPFR
ncbi:protein NPGR2-like [Rutidosis leptorrhynchoides]|uniref:protein NPGR2-like n=1 Tax=Rutidosis leptorrhynchoides TaxID=125765 RepID=UPI003A999733